MSTDTRTIVRSEDFLACFSTSLLALLWKLPVTHSVPFVGMGANFMLAIEAGEIQKGRFLFVPPTHDGMTNA